MERQNRRNEKLKQNLEHWDEQAHRRYRFLIGEWRGTRRAKCTRTGKFVSIEIVHNYLDNKID